MCPKTSENPAPEKSKIQPPAPALKYWIDLSKWVITSVALVVAGLIIDSGISIRKTSLNELKEYGNYITELIVLNPDPVNRYYLAQYMTCVTTSKPLRDGWKAYFDSVYPEYIQYKDSLDRVYEQLMESYQEIKASGIEKTDQWDNLLKMEQLMEANRQKLIPSFRLPERSEPPPDDQTP